MTTTLFRSAGTAVVATDGVVDWVGPAASAGSGADRTVHLDGWLLPAFRDAHVHVTQTGLALTGLDLHDATSLADALDRLERHARARRGRPVLGGGWDETRWPEQRRPTAAELDRAAYGGLVYLPRVDQHGAVASSALLHAAGVASADGWVSLDDHHAVRRVAYASLTAADTAAAQAVALDHFAARGVAQVHECAGPQISGAGDLEQLLATPSPVEVVATWGDLGDVETPKRLGLRSAAGDLFCDGSVGSRTAALHAPYTDAPDTLGHLKHDAAAVAAHVVAAVEAGLGSGFHAIGDRAIDEVLAGYEMAAAQTGAAFRAVSHRIEHCEMASAAAIGTMARLGVEVSAQPPFDATWGGAEGMYVQRLGRERGLALNPFAAFVAAGVGLRFGTDSPICPVDPWGGVRAAVQHRTPAARIPADVAFDCHTVPLAAGGPVTFAVWSHDGRTDIETTPELVSASFGAA